MPHEKIKKYYLLCETQLGERRHVINEIPSEKLNIILNKKEIDLYLRKQDGLYIPKETVIGGAERGGIITVID